MQQFRHRQLVTDQLSNEEISVILRELQKLLKDGVEGDVVELGCYEGGSAVAMQELLATYEYPKQLWLYDSFEGLPEKTQEDLSPRGESFRAGALKASKARLQRHFVKRGLAIPEIKRAWFFELDPEDMPSSIALAFLDGDFYESIMDSLTLIYPKMSSRGVIIIDDYENSALPGVRRAVDEWVAKHSYSLIVEKSLAILHAEQL